MGQGKMRTVFILLTLLCLLTAHTVADHPAWDCPECGRKGNTGNFCGNCAHPAPEQEDMPIYSTEPFLQETTEPAAPATIIPQQKTYAAGDTILFGQYEQDNNPNNGMEPIEWVVLDYDASEGKVLLLSSYGLDGKEYQTPFARTTWKECTLRAWLNSDFLNTVFSEQEKNAIILSHVDNSLNQGNKEWDTNGGNDTLDYLFLLSYQETAEKYFKDDQSRECKPTAFAAAQGVEVSDYHGNCMWWLRSPGPTQSSAGEVYPTGYLSFMSESFIRSVRPAFWLKLNP